MGHRLIQIALHERRQRLSETKLILRVDRHQIGSVQNVLRESCPGLDGIERCHARQSRPLAGDLKTRRIGGRVVRDIGSLHEEVQIMRPVAGRIMIE